MKISNNNLLMGNSHHQISRPEFSIQLTILMLTMGKVKVLVQVSTRRHIRLQVVVMFRVCPIKLHPVFQRVFVL